MKFVADLHIHSHYSRATSKDLNFEHLTKWAQLKGVQVVGTGDIAHPGWLQEMKDKLEPAEEGLFRLKDEYTRAIEKEVPGACHNTVRFMLAGEISNIYKKNDKVRKIHNVVFLPTFEAVEKFQAELEKIGNIRSDGRPILGLDARDLLEIVLNTDPWAYLIPAHIWTPWFSLFGSKSGFDSIEECFEDLTPHIFALETGLSSDPPMNWRCSALDRYTLVSNSDAHSPQKLAREANLFNTELSYPAIFEALRTGDSQTFGGTIEFFPEEGKYHYDGHRKCGIRWNPKTTLEHNSICPECGKAVTVGVMHRVEVLADREEDDKQENRPPFYSLIPLPEVFAEVLGVGAASKRVQENHRALLAKLGSELTILQQTPLEDIEKSGGARLAEGIRRMREGDINVAAGYDGEYGIIKLFDEREKEIYPSQLDFFGSPKKPEKQAGQTPLDLFDSLPAENQPRQTVREEEESGQYKKVADSAVRPPAGSDTQPSMEKEEAGHKQNQEKIKPSNIQKSGEENPIISGLNREQQEAVLSIDVPLIILAGPGTGKTRTLTHRIAYLVGEKGVSPEQILAITFTNKAAEEMAYRLKQLLEAEVFSGMTIKTFHAFGAMIQRENAEKIERNFDFSILNEDDRKALLKQCSPGFSSKQLTQYLDDISAAKNRLLLPDDEELTSQYPGDPDFPAVYRTYQNALRKSRALDFDDLILQPVKLMEKFPEFLSHYQQRFRWISVDEYQDINHAQYRLLRLLTGPEANLCVIGDPDQAIYGFRGASREYFLKFQEDYPRARGIQLAQNYRSTRNILNASRQVMSRSAESREFDLWSEIISHTRLEIYQAPTHKAEAEYVVHQIEKMVGGTSYFSLDSGRVDDEEESGSRSFSDFAVLYRLGALGYFLEEAFLRSGIPYQTAGQIPFFELKEVQEILTYLWLLYNPQSVFHLQKINRKLNTVTGFLDELRASTHIQPVSKLIERIDTFIKKNPDTPAEKRAERIRRLIRKAAPFDNRLGDFLETSVLQRESDDYDPRADRVTLMTLHASKGLEFPVVFIIGCEENLIPYRRDGKSCDEEEERRLFYVGMTRAQEKLILTHAKKRFLFGKTVNFTPSRYLSDIEQALKEYKQMEARKKTSRDKPDDRQLKLF
jgi:uncharacterized protein (TIGR00375 family)